MAIILHTVFHSDSNFLMKFWPPFDFNIYVMGEKYKLSLQCAFLVLGNLVESSKITKKFLAVLNKIFSFWLTKCFNIFQEGLSRLIDRLFTNLLNINITKTRTEEIKSSDGEEFRTFKLKLA